MRINTCPRVFNTSTHPLTANSRTMAYFGKPMNYVNLCEVLPWSPYAGNFGLKNYFISRLNGYCRLKKTPDNVIRVYTTMFLNFLFGLILNRTK
jgi:hypothetical protein